MESVRVAILALFLLLVFGRSNANVEEENPEFWRSQAQKTLQSALDRNLNTNVAKNILFFLGDGMGMTTYTAARILKGQLQNQTGEETVMTMDTFPNVGLAKRNHVQNSVSSAAEALAFVRAMTQTNLVERGIILLKKMDFNFTVCGLTKTYSVDFQIPDSAATGTAYLCGVKTNFNVVGLSAAARNGVCKTQKGNEVTSILKWAKDAGKSVGIVTTTRVQHATPAASYAHSASRSWYSDADMSAAAKRDGCTDISSQLLNNTDIDVIIGGGRKYMTPQYTRDPEYPSDIFAWGQRKDGRNLIDEWQSLKSGKVAHYVWNKTDFDAVDPETTDYLMALFEPGDMLYEVEKDPNMDPSIVETTEKAIRILRKNPKGFFLLVEGGRIDQAHHAGRAAVSLHEAVAFDDAIAKGLELTEEHETLTIVTADHSQPMTWNGFPFRGQSILGKSPLWGTDFLPFTTLMYGNGPGYKVINGTRPDIRNVDTKSMDYRQLAAVPLDQTSHSGEDVAVLARGPMAHLFQGVQEQNYIAHAMAYAACVGTDLRHCQTQPTTPAATTTPDNGASPVRVSAAFLSSLLSLLLVLQVLM